MEHRILAWLGIGLLTIWVGVALAVGTAVASADTEPGPTQNEASTSEPAAGPRAPENPAPDEDAPDDDAIEDEPDENPIDEETPPETGEDTIDEELPIEPGADVITDDGAEDVVTETPDGQEPSGEPTETVTPELPADTATGEDGDALEETDESGEEGVEGLIEENLTNEEPLDDGATDGAVDGGTEETGDGTLTALTASNYRAAKTEATQTIRAAAPALTAQGPTLINIVGTLFFSVFDAVVRLFEGPPAVPPGSSVRVERRPLEIDCGDGYTVDADWYFPTETEPDKIIFFGHGGFGRAGMYNVTAAELAERNNAIVVAPSITSNFFACDGCAQGLDPMHAAVADLFRGDRAALTASAQAAGWEGELPERFVIAGHSGGGQLAAGAAGYYTRFASDEDDRDLAGVLLLDTSPVGGALERALDKIPEYIPVYTISAEPAPLNSYGGADEVLAAERDGFVGVRLIGGVHSDGWQWTNTVAQFFVGLATGGTAQPQNVEAVQVLAQGWITDWFETDPAAEPVGYYGERGAVIDIETSAGTAQAYASPGPAPQMTIIDRILEAAVDSAALLQVFSGNCAVDPDEQQVQARNSTTKIGLSLDGPRLTGQSVGQHVCTD